MFQLASGPLLVSVRPLSQTSYVGYSDNYMYAKGDGSIVYSRQSQRVPYGSMLPAATVKRTERRRTALLLHTDKDEFPTTPYTRGSGKSAAPKLVELCAAACKADPDEFGLKANKVTVQSLMEETCRKSGLVSDRRSRGLAEMSPQSANMNGTHPKRPLRSV